MSSVLAHAALVCHPLTPSRALVALGVEISLTGSHGWQIVFRGVGDVASLHVPDPALAAHTDELWRTTCFELFMALEGDAYAEFNFSPSSAWAAYHFDHYRTAMRPWEIPAPQIAMTGGKDEFSLTVTLDEDALPWDRAGPIGVNAVIEEADGAISYWAVAHPSGRPDFHHRDCFALMVPPVDRS